jgi:hypothetical protein
LSYLCCQFDIFPIGGSFQNLSERAKPLEVPIEVGVGQKKLVHKGVEAYVAFLSLFLKI